MKYKTTQVNAIKTCSNKPLSSNFMNKPEFDHIITEKSIDNKINKIYSCKISVKKISYASINNHKIDTYELVQKLIIHISSSNVSINSKFHAVPCTISNNSKGMNL